MTLSIIMPSRGRPEMLARTVAKLTEVPSDLQIIVGLDSDDPARGAALELLAGMAAVHPVVGERPASLGALTNKLLAHATGEWLMMGTDDIEVSTPDWGERVERVLRKLPNRMGVAYLNDHKLPGFSTVPIVSREMVEIVGFLNAPWFPFLFGDDWWDEIGHLSMLKFLVPDVVVTFAQAEGMSHQIHDLDFWQRFYDFLAPMRVTAAAEIVRRGFDDSVMGNQVLALIPEREAKCIAMHEYRRTGPIVANLESKWPKTERYLALKAKAERVMGILQKAAA